MRVATDDNSVLIATKLTTSQVVALLKDNVASPLRFPWVGIVGSVGASTAWLGNRGWFFNQQQRRLYLRYTSGVTGTVVRGKFSYPLFARAVFAIFGSVAIALSLYSFFAHNTSFLPILGIALLGSLLFVVTRLELRIRTRRELELLDFLNDLLASAPHEEVPGGVLIRPRHMTPSE